MAKPKKVKIVVMRHGEKTAATPERSNDLSELTPKGVQQVVDSATNNLLGYKPDALYCSLKYRAMQTVLGMTSVLPGRNGGLSIIADNRFDYSDAPDLKNFGDWEKEAKRRVAEEDKKETIEMWLDIAPTAVGFLRNKITESLKMTAVEIASTSDKDEYTVFVGCHSPVAETACVNPADMPRLQEADIVVYTVEVYDYDPLGGSVADIVASEYIPRGF
jgi:broad specificity phosphatase PhoE